MIKPVVCIISDLGLPLVSLNGVEVHILSINATLQDVKLVGADVYVSLGNDWEKFPFVNLPYHEKFKWIHLNEIEHLSENAIFNCYFSSMYNKEVKKISIFTPAYNSGDKILRPLNSLLSQTYQNWEWIIWDDSDNGSLTLGIHDDRIKIYRAQEHCGIIGKVKKLAASCCTGDYLLELDHDDELTPDALEKVVDTFERYPEVGFVYSDFCELYEDGTPFGYGDFFSFGYGSYYAKKYKDKICWVANSSRINSKTLSHIVGVPNHLRCWRRDIYHQMGGHNEHLHVADDYELILRTFLHTKMCRIPHMLYLQYRNVDGNTTQTRNGEIQKFVSWIQYLFKDRIDKRVVELGGTVFIDEVPQIWTTETPVLHEELNLVNTQWSPKVSIIIPTYKRPKDLKMAINSALLQSYQDFEIIVIGDNCPDMDDVMMKIDSPKVKWWNLSQNKGSVGSWSRNYAIKMISNSDIITYLDDDNMWLPNHLNSLFTTLNDSDSMYSFSSFVVDGKSIICNEPVKYRVDTSSIMHKKSLMYKYGWWRDSSIVGYATDWDMVSRWKDEKWIATELPTLCYNTEYNSQTYESIKNAV